MMMFLNKSDEKKLHTCPLNSWFYKCAYCEFDYDDLKRRIENKSEPNDQKYFKLVLEERIKSTNLILESNKFKLLKL